MGAGAGSEELGLGLALGCEERDARGRRCVCGFGSVDEEEWEREASWWVMDVNGSFRALNARSRSRFLNVHENEIHKIE